MGIEVLYGRGQCNAASYKGKTRNDFLCEAILSQSNLRLTFGHVGHMCCPEAESQYRSPDCALRKVELISLQGEVETGSVYRRVS